MIRAAKIRVGLLGGRGYGKTVFLTKLISLADSSDDGFIQFDAGSEALQIKNLMLENDGRLPATAIKEISKYNFVLGKQSGDKWRIQFCDYAGELLERIETKSNNEKAEDASSSTETNSEAQSAEDYTANEGNSPYIKKIKRWLKRCDAFIVLFPVNINDRDEQKNRLYPSSEINIFRQNVGLLLNIMQKDPVLSNRPVCLAINKWDLISKGTLFSEIEKTEPFILFKNQLSNICGKNFFCMPISAFGKHKDGKPDEADPSGKPFQVAEMLLNLAEKAEYARVVSIRDTIKRLPRFVGWPLYPVLLSGNLIRGITNARLQKLNSLLWKKYGIRFAINASISTCCIFLLICATMITLLGIELKSIQREIQNGFYSPDQIVKLERDLYKPRFFRFVYHYSYSSLMSVGELEKRFKEQKNTYNARILSETEKYYLDREKEIKDNGLDPKIRKSRISEVETRITTAQKKMTADSPCRIGLQKLMDKVSELSRNTQENESFDVAYQAWISIQDEFEKARAAVLFLKTYTLAKYPQRKTHIDSVTRQRQEIETQKFNDLVASLHREIYGDDFGEKTDDYPGRIKRAQARIREIEDAKKRLPDSHLLAKYDSLIKEDENRIAYLQKYGHFDVQVEQLLIATDKDIIHKILNFISENQRGYSDLRTESLNKLSNRVRELNAQFMRELQLQLKSPDVAADPSAKFERQIDLANKRIALIEEMKPRLSEQSLIESCKDLISMNKALIEERRLYGPFEIELQKVYSTPEAKRIAAIIAFFEKYPAAEYPDKANDLKLLANHKATLEDQFLSALQKRLPVRNAQAKWREQREIARQTIAIVEEERKKFSENSEPWKKCSAKIQAEHAYISSLEYNGKFDDGYEKLLMLPQNDGYIREIKKFISEFDAKTYPDRKNVVTKLEQEITQRELVLATELTTLSIPESSKWQDRVKIYQNRIAEIENRLQFFLDGSPHIASLNDFKKYLQAKKTVVEHYGKFDDAYAKLNTDLPAQTIPTRIKLLDMFLQNYGVNDFPERKIQISECENKIEICDQKIRQDALKELEIPQNADSDSLDWETKITRMRNRIKICERVLLQISKHSKYRQEFSVRIASLKSEIASIENYKVYYRAYSDVEAKSDLYKVVAIDEFIRKYGNQYPSPLPRYTIERLQEQKTKLIAKYEKELNTLLTTAKDSPDLSWSVRHERCKQRLEALRFFVQATGLEKSATIKDTEQMLTLAERHIAFEKSVYNITHFHGDSLGLFSAIYRFYSDYPAQEWEKTRKQDYETVRNMERKKVSEIMTTLQGEISKYKKMDSLAMVEANLNAQLNAYRSCQKKLYRDIPEFNEIEASISSVNTQLNIIHKAQRNLERIENLLIEEKSVAPARIDAIGALLTGISNLVQEVPAEQVHPMIKGKYDELLTAREKWNGELYKKMKAELHPYETSLEGGNLTDEEKGTVYDKLLAIRNKYLSLYSPESRQFDLARREYENSVRSQDQAKKEKKIKDNLEELIATLKDSGNGIDLKLGKIQEFETLMGAIGQEKEFPRFREEFNFVNNMKEMLNWDLKFAELRSNISKIIQNPPSQDDESKILRFITSCEDYKSKLVPFTENKRTSSGANELNNRLIELSDRYQAVAQEWVLYKAVKIARKDFMDNPEDSSFTAFKDAVWNLRQHKIKNNAHDKEIQAWEEQVVKINNTRIALNNQFAEFRSRKTSHCLSQLRNLAHEYQGQGMKNRITDYVNKLDYPQLWDKRITVILWDYNFENSGFRSPAGWDVDFNAKVSGFAVTMEFDLPDIAGSHKNNPGHSYLENRIGSTRIRNQGFASIQNSVTVEFMNYNCRNDVGSETVEFAYILAKGLDSGSCQIDFSASSRRRPNLGQGHVYIQFEGLPRY